MRKLTEIIRDIGIGAALCGFSVGLVWGISELKKIIYPTTQTLQMDYNSSQGEVPYTLNR